MEYQLVTLGNSLNKDFLFVFFNVHSTIVCPIWILRLSFVFFFVWFQIEDKTKKSVFSNAHTHTHGQQEEWREDTIFRIEILNYCCWQDKYD